MSDPHEERTRKARADLERLSQQSEKLLGAGGGEAPPASDDWAEVWGRRLGRLGGVLLGVYLLWWFASRYGLV